MNSFLINRTSTIHWGRGNAASCNGGGHGKMPAYRYISETAVIAAPASRFCKKCFKKGKPDAERIGEIFAANA